MIPKSQLISLSLVPGMGPRRIRSLLWQYLEVENMTMLSKSDVMQVYVISHDLCTQMKKDTPEILSTLLLSGIKKPRLAASGEIIYKICVNNYFVCDLSHIDNMLAECNFILMKVTMCYKNV